MSTLDVTALAIAALLAGAGAMVLLAARFRNRDADQSSGRRLTTSTLAVVSLALLVGAHQAAAGPLGWSPRLPAAFVAVALLVVIGLSVALDVRSAPDAPDEVDS